MGGLGADRGSGQAEIHSSTGKQQPPSKKRKGHADTIPQFVFRYGNYHSYYGYRLKSSADEDPRLNYFRREWFEGKDCLDIGCNEGFVTIAIAQKFNCRSMLGIDIDGVLIKKALSNLQEEAAVLQGCPKDVRVLEPCEDTEERCHEVEGAQAPRMDCGRACSGSMDSRSNINDEQICADARHPEKWHRKGKSQGSPEVGGGSTFSCSGDTRVNSEEEIVEFSDLKEEVRLGTEILEESCSKQARLVVPHNNIGEKCVEGGGNQGVPVKNSGSACSNNEDLRLRVSEDQFNEDFPHGRRPDEEEGNQRQSETYCSSVPGFGSLLQRVKFREEDFIEDFPLGKFRKDGMFNTVLCLSVTKWVHLNWGDDGLIRLFAKIYHILQPGGLLILEPQPWRSYKRKYRVSETTRRHFWEILIRPMHFQEILLDKIGFKSVQEISSAVPNSRLGFNRSLFLYVK